MHGTDFAWSVREQTRTNSTTLTDSDLVRYANIVKDDELVQEVMKIDEKVFTTPQTTNLVANQREYDFPNDILARLHRVDAKLDGSEFIKLASTNIKDIEYSLTEENITAHFSNNQGEAAHDIIRKGIYIFSGTITDVADGLKVWYETFPADISTSDLSGTQDLSVDPSTTEHGIPRELHSVWVDMISKKWKENNGVELTESEANYRHNLRQAVESLKHQDLNEAQLGKVPSGDDTWNNGFNL